jgi:hypothetical protein
MSEDVKTVWLTDDKIGAVWLAGTVVCAMGVVCVSPWISIVAWGIMTFTMIGSKVIGLI